MHGLEKQCTCLSSWHVPFAWASINLFLACQVLPAVCGHIARIHCRRRGQISKTIERPAIDDDNVVDKTMVRMSRLPDPLHEQAS